MAFAACDFYWHHPPACVLDLPGVGCRPFCDSRIKRDDRLGYSSGCYGSKLCYGSSNLRTQDTSRVARITPQPNALASFVGSFSLRPDGTSQGFVLGSSVWIKKPAPRTRGRCLCVG